MFLEKRHNNIQNIYKYRLNIMKTCKNDKTNNALILWHSFCLTIIKYLNKKLMRKTFKLLLAAVLCTGGFSLFAQNGNIGIGTTSPGTKLDVNGGITMRETILDASSGTATIPADVSQVKLTGTPTGVVSITAAAAPNAGQRLMVYNSTAQKASLNGFVIPEFQAIEFVYSGNDWQANAGASAGKFWNITGNDGVQPYQYVGTNDNADLSIRTNSVDRLHISGATGNVGLNTQTPDANALMDMNSSTKGLLIPRLTTAQRDAIPSKPDGLMIYNTDIHCLQYWNTTQWIGNCGNSNNGQGTISSCTSGTLSGTYQAGTAMNSSNTVVLALNVTQTGSWVANTNTINGVTFSGSGVFTATGAQNITLTATGTPVAGGTFGFTFSLGASTCTRNITFAGLPACPTPSAMVLASSAGLNIQTGGNSTFSISSGGTPNTSIAWNIAPTAGVSATSGTGNNTGAITFSNPNTYKVFFTATNTGGSCATTSRTDSLAVTVSNTPPAPTSICTPALGSSNFPGDYTIGTNLVHVTSSRPTTTNIINNKTFCGQTIPCPTSNVLGQTGLMSVTFHFDRPVTNVGLLLTAFETGEVITVTATNGATAVTPVFTRTCNTTSTFTSNQIVAGPNNSGDNNFGFNIGGVYFTDITLTHNGQNSGTASRLTFCNSASQ